MRKLLLFFFLVMPCFGQDLRPSAYVGQQKKVTVRGGKVQGSTGGVTTLATTDITPTVNATTYIYVDLSSTPVISTSTSGFPSSSYFPICVVVADINGIITSFTDSRPDYFMAGGGGGGISSIAPNIKSSTAKWDGQRGIFPNVTVTNGSNQVTVSTASFTSADIGKAMFCTNWDGTDSFYGTSGGNKVLIGNTTPNGNPTIISSIVNSTTVALQTNGSNQNAVASSDASHGYCRWGTDDTTAHTNDYNAVTPANGICGALQLGAGDSLVSAPQFSGTKTCIGGGTGQNSKYASVIGAGRDGPSVLVPVPWGNFTSASCPSLGFFFGATQGLGFTDIVIDGAGNNLTGQTIACGVVGTTIDGTIERVMAIGWGSDVPGMVGMKFNGGYHIASTLTIDGAGGGAGGANCTAGGSNQAAIYALFCGNGRGAALSINAGAFFSPEGLFTQCVGLSSACINNSGTFICSKCNGSLAGSTLSHIFTPAGGISVVHDSLYNASAASGAVFNVQGSGKQFAFNNPLLQATGGSANVWLCQGASGCFDEGGNIYSNGPAGNAPTCAMTTGGGTGPACALVAGSTNEKGTIRMTPGTTPAATGTTTLTFFGTFAGPTGTTPSCNFSYANTGTGAWSLTTTTPIVMTTRSTTVPVFNWNQTGALTAASTYDIDYVCVPR